MEGKRQQLSFFIIFQTEDVNKVIFSYRGEKGWGERKKERKKGGGRERKKEKKVGGEKERKKGRRNRSTKNCLYLMFAVWQQTFLIRLHFINFFEIKINWITNYLFMVIEFPECLMIEDEVEWDSKFWNNYTAMYNQLKLSILLKNLLFKNNFEKKYVC